MPEEELQEKSRSAIYTRRNEVEGAIMPKEEPQEKSQEEPPEPSKFAGRTWHYTKEERQILKNLKKIKVPVPHPKLGTGKLQTKKAMAMNELRGKFEIIAYKQMAKKAKKLAKHAIKLALESTVEHPTPLLRAIDKILPDAMRRIEISKNMEAEEGRKYLNNLKLDPRSIELLEELTERIVSQRAIDVTPAHPLSNSESPSSPTQ